MKSQGWMGAILMGLSFNTAGCDSDDAEQAPAPQGDVLTVTTTAVTLDSGGELYVCWSLQIPDDVPFQLQGIEFEVSDDVHHFQLQALSEVSGEGPYECGFGGGGGIPTILAVGGPGIAPRLDYPPGTAIPLAAGSFVVLQLHILNTSQEAREYAPAHAHLERASESDGLAEVGVALVNDSNLLLPPMTGGVAAGYDCVVPERLEHVFSVWPHMHKLGKHIDITLGGETVVDIDWSFEDQLRFPTDHAVEVGEAVGVHCVFDNTTVEEVTFGMSTKDEMCTAFVYYYPAIPGFVSCESGQR